MKTTKRNSHCGGSCIEYVWSGEVKRRRQKRSTTKKRGEGKKGKAFNDDENKKYKQSRRRGWCIRTYLLKFLYIEKGIFVCHFRAASIFTYIFRRDWGFFCGVKESYSHFQDFCFTFKINYWKKRSRESYFKKCSQNRFWSPVSDNNETG